MLVELRCEKLIKSKIEFNDNLNIVLGDNNATNSIGKSTFLMILDFIFGGESYLKHNIDVLNNIGDHEFLYSFKFNKKILRYKRIASIKGVKESKIYLCDDNYEKPEDVDIKEYTKNLKELYNLEAIPMSFRQIVGLYSRVWGKENHSIKRPLHDFPKEKNSDCVDKIMKTFLKYDDIITLKTGQDYLEKKKKNLNATFQEGIVTKITKTIFRKNTKRINELNEIKEKLKNNSDDFKCQQLNETIKKIIFLRKIRENKLNEVTILENKIVNLNYKTKNNKTLTPKEIKKLREFFPNLDLNKIKEIDIFYKNINNILKKEIKENIEETKKELANSNKNISEINIKIENIKKETDNSSKEWVDKITEIALELNKLNQENSIYENYISYNKEIKIYKENIENNKIEKLDTIAKIMNKNMTDVNQNLNPGKTPPTLTLEGKDYLFEVSNDKGTGKGYESLLVFDLTILKETLLPFVIHDSFLFKNLSTNTIENLLVEYRKYSKQIFISIDAKSNYKKEIQNLIEKYKVLELSKDKPLFKIDWSKKTNQ